MKNENQNQNEKKENNTEKVPKESEIINKRIRNQIELYAAMEYDKKLHQSEEDYFKKIAISDSSILGYKPVQERLKLIPKYTNYMEYMIELLRMLPRTEKFNLGQEFKKVMYETFENIMYIDKLEDKNKMYYLNKIDAQINVQRVYLRIMAKYQWISVDKFNIIMLEMLAEIGRILGGLIKYHAKNNKK